MINKVSHVMKRGEIGLKLLSEKRPAFSSVRSKAVDDNDDDDDDVMDYFQLS